MIKVLIADDHLLIREGLKKILDREVDMQVIGEAGNAGEVVEIIRQEECEVLVLDISMPGKSGLDLLKELKGWNADLRVLILSMHPEERFAVRALKAGASGYITKESASEQLVTAIRKVYNGGRYISAALAEQLAFDLVRDQEKPLHETLSDREFQVLRLIGTGQSLNKIADDLAISVSTVNTYRKRILEKMKLKSNAELIHYVVRNHIID